MITYNDDYHMGRKVANAFELELCRLSKKVIPHSLNNRNTKGIEQGIIQIIIPHHQRIAVMKFAVTPLKTNRKTANKTALQAFSRC